jgi:uncharacterized protein YcbK (DUF882 family)
LVTPILLLLLASAPAPEAGPPSKKEAYLASKQDERSSRRRRARRRALEVVYGRNLRTHEIMPLSLPGLRPRAYDEFFRCWFTNEHGDVPDELVAVVLAAAEHFEVREIQVISGFRHPKYNLLLRKKGRQVGRDSKHTRATAIDFLLPGVRTRALYRYLLANHDGGVGYYPRSEFVHIDTGPKRTWRGT